MNRLKVIFRRWMLPYLQPVAQAYQQWASSQARFHPNYMWIGLFLALLLYADHLAGHRPFTGLSSSDVQSQESEPTPLETLNLD